MGMGVLWGILGDPFGLQQEDPMEALYKKIMEEVKELIDENAMKRDLEEHRAEMTALLQEMDWFPEVLQQVGTGATQGLESHTAVLWHIMVQQHIALLTGKLWSAPCLTNVYSDSCRSWQQKPGVLELALKLAGIQQQELLEIARLEPSYRDGLDKRMLQVIQSHYRQASAAFQVYVHARLHNYVHDGRDDFPGATSLGNGHDNQKKIFDKTHRSLRSHISKWAALLGAAEGATNSFYTSQSVDDPPVVSLNPRNHENWRIHTTEQPNGVLRVITGLFIWLGGDVGFHTVTFLSQDLVRAHQAKVQTIDHAGDHSHWKRCPVGTFMRAMYSPLGSNRRRHDPWTHWDKTECVEIPVTPTPLSEDSYVHDNCYNIDAIYLLDHHGDLKRWVQCDPGYALRGILQGNGEGVSNLQEFQCCSLAPLGARNRELRIDDATYKMRQVPYQQLDFEGFNNLGNGHCDSGYYTTHHGETFQSCAALCNRDSNCKFISVVNGIYCAFYDTTDCGLRIHHKHEYTSYQKVDYRKRVPNYSYLGWGYCKNHYLRGWVAADAISFQACADKCDEEADCKYFALFKDHTCSRYSAQAQDGCASRYHAVRTQANPHISYEKIR
ncbi:unnamed protein product [Symbiodinium natans]|uniref:Apple domain-containing protein n=1 Tax=Symbiodinium natans TaxID=878477 RepID=A0A812VCN1_9DINO|nr:unnamed protein product [Symbiodinium natans]